MIETRFETGILFPGKFNQQTAESMPTITLLYVLDKYITEPYRIVEDYVLDAEDVMKNVPKEDVKTVAQDIRDSLTYITSLPNDDLLCYFLTSKYYTDVVDELSFRGVNWEIYIENVSHTRR